MNNNIKIPKRLFGLLCKYFLLNCKDFVVEEEICRELEWKLEAMEKRDNYRRAVDDTPPRSGAVDDTEKGNV